MAKPITCRRGEKRFTVLKINGDPYDTFAARSFEAALRLAQPDRGDLVEVFRVCAKDAGEARLPHAGRASRRIRKFRFKRGG